MMRGRTRRAIVSFVGAAVVLVASIASVHPVGAAQTDDPYGPTSTTSPSSFNPTLELSATSGEPGTRIEARVSDVPPGSTIRILFDGEEVGRGTATAGPSAFRGTVGGQPGATVEIDFVVPDVGPGSYVVSAVGPNFTVEFDGFEVLASAEGGVTGSNDGGGRLAFTGLNILLLALVALALIVGGRAIVKAARERRDARIY